MNELYGSLGEGKQHAEGDACCLVGKEQEGGLTMLFRPSTLSFGKKPNDATPEYRVAAHATVDLREHMKKNPHRILSIDNLTWAISRDEDGYYVCKGEINIPVEMIFDVDDEGNFIKKRVFIDGTKRFDDRDPKVKEFDPLDSIDVDQARIEAYSRYRSNIDTI